MGVDYAIFLLEHPSADAGEAWLAVGVGAVSTFLAFGLLATSESPAVHAFGLTMGIGIITVWLLSPLIVDGLDAPEGIKAIFSSRVRPSRSRNQDSK
jgi:predicted exporter